MTLHEDEIPTDESLVRRLLAQQRPEWAELSIRPAGSGTDNRMFRLGDGLLVRLPRTPGTAGAVRKEQVWLPRLAPELACEVPEPVHEGVPGSGFPLPWSVYRWIEGAEPGPDSVPDWGVFGTELAAAVRSLHALPLPPEDAREGLHWYRGGELAPCDPWVGEYFAQARMLPGLDLDLDRLQAIWHAAHALPAPAGPRVWLHGDLKPSNVLVQDGRLRAVIDFGGLSIGFPDAEHAPLWDFPAAARHAYRAALDVNEQTWQRACGWAVAVAIAGVPYYWESDPAFAAECVARLRAVLDDPAGL
ncbi:aminoglycoside phosphotransferase family protein [Kitasatospora griseola]|uniref:aminoglycoside phosphotransferase family protein n=1 Tax=Kitasatospora griseola TaxID=2064 RepID=UPI00167013C7|nr:aminoglycoside phosphotransferase family protein [Kitasatospora griseola]GGQ90559.1 phosphotransferase [Kitasatospora griseola]